MKALGFDTSNYTASVCSYDGNEINSLRKMVPVKQGERGIRQSEGVFFHMKTLPELYCELDVSGAAAVGASVKPRGAKGSYMPVFLAGEGYARVAAKTLGVPFYPFTHQDGHIAAGILSGGHTELFDGAFLSVHISGGTTEILLCRYDADGFNARIIGGTKDISAGQLIDRAGVYMGLPFPAGRHVEELAKKGGKKLAMPVSVSGAWMNFSGTENKVTRYLVSESPGDVALAVQDAVARTLVKAINAAAAASGLSRVLIIGGVASNEYIRGRLAEGLNARTLFASPQYSSDNAAGIAFLTYLKHGKGM